MANIDVVDLGGKKVGTLELADEVFGGQVNEELLWEAVKHYRAALRQGTHATKNRKLVSGSRQEVVEAEGNGPGAHRLDPLAAVEAWRHGARAGAAFHDYAFPRKKLLGALRSAMAAKLADGKLTVVESLELKEPKTKLYRAALTTLEAKKTALLVESGATLSKNLLLGARNLEGVELMLSNEVHPYDLLKHERAIFSGRRWSSCRRR